LVNTETVDVTSIVLGTPIMRYKQGSKGWLGGNSVVIGGVGATENVGHEQTETRLAEYRPSAWFQFVLSGVTGMIVCTIESVCGDVSGRGPMSMSDQDDAFVRMWCAQSSIDAVSAVALFTIEIVCVKMVQEGISQTKMWKWKEWKLAILRYFDNTCSLVICEM
jgi:hypothetical protein